MIAARLYSGEGTMSMECQRGSVAEACDEAEEALK